MIIYQANKGEFLRHVYHDDIEVVVSRQFEAATGRRPQQGEVQAWKESLPEMAKVLADEEIPDDTGVGIEFQLPTGTMRVDFIITGEDIDSRARLIIVELKRWSTSRRSEKDAIVWARRGGPRGESEGTHPSYQAWSYAAYLQDFNETVQGGEITLNPCAYLHNHPRDGEIDHPHYAEHIARAPLFLARERALLQAFIREHVRHGDRRGILYEVEKGRIRPSKMLADSVNGLIQGRPEFTLIDSQKVVYEAILEADSKADLRKQVVVVRGGPGTGKSVVALNLLGALLNRRRNVRYVSKNAAPRSVYAAKLAGTMTKTRINNLFNGSGSFIETVAEKFDVLIVDEAHRLNAKSGLYRNKGDDQTREIIRSSRCTVFFVDDRQRVTMDDVGQAAFLLARAREAGAEITEPEPLSSQFRCNGSDGYLAWLDNTLEIESTANTTLDSRDFDFRVMDSPTELHDLIELKNKKDNRSRVVAGYCWRWPSKKKNPAAWDIEIPEFDYRRRWNLGKDGSLWIITPGSIDQVGCIHTCQGLELDYVGVIIGPDIGYRDGKIFTDIRNRAPSDQSVRGLKKLMKSDITRARELGDEIVKNTYRALMTRGMKGCYVYCTDRSLADHLRSHLRLNRAVPVDASDSKTNVIPLRRVGHEERLRGVEAIPVIELRFAASAFSDAQATEESARYWVESPAERRREIGLFVAQVVGESMNRRIPNGAWCLFRAHPTGTREGKVVVVQHRSISDPETGGRYTIKRYSSEKVRAEAGDWVHRRITLNPDSTLPQFTPIVIEQTEEHDDLTVVAEFLEVLQKKDC